jgi:hypothetical protein
MKIPWLEYQQQFGLLYHLGAYNLLDVLSRLWLGYLHIHRSRFATCHIGSWFGQPCGNRRSFGTLMAE